MKLQNTIFASALAVLALSSCTKENEYNGQTPTSNAIEFTSSIAGSDSETRVDGTTWAGGEQVGVFMLDAATSAFSISDNGTNKAYTGQADGSLAATSSALAFPSDKSEVRFIAYYPYQKSADAGTYTIDLTKDGDNDLLFSSDATPYSATSEGKVNLSFSHKLAKLQLTLTSDISGNPIDPSKVQMRAEMLTAGTFSLKTQTGELTVGDAVNEVSIPVADVSGKAVGSVIVFPSIEQVSYTKSAATTSTITKLTFIVDGKEYVFSDPSLLANLTANNQYNFDVSLSEDAQAMVTLTSTIQAWTIVDKGTLIAKPTDGDDDPTPPVTGQKIAQARALAPTENNATAVISQEMTVTGSVIAQNDPSGSFYRVVIISDGESALYLYDETTANMSFAIGDEVTVDLNGATLKNYNGLIEAMSTGTDYELSAHVTKTGNTKVIEPVVVSAADLANYQSMLVTIKDATAPAGSTTWGAADANTTIELTSPTGAFNVYTSKHSNFVTEAVPTGTGNVTGIVGWYNAPQIIFASADGWTGMTGENNGGGEDNPTPPAAGQKIADARALAPADGATAVISQAMTVTGSVIAQNDPSGSFYRAVIISDGETALYLYDETTANMSFAIGDEVTVDLNGATLKNYYGLIEAMSTGTDYALSSHITKTGNTKVIAPKVINASDMANYQSMYVTIADAQAADGHPANWGASDANTSVNMTSPTGDFVVYVGKYCNFKDTAIGTGTGAVSGIVGWYKNPQLIFSKADDFANL